MAWGYLVIAGIFEIVWAFGLKYTDGFTRLWPTIGTFAAMAVSLLFLEWAVRTIPLGTAYAVWTGIGIAGTATLGIIVFNEPTTVLRLVCIGMILSGIVGLKFLSA
ncbi:MAG: QacE family quaternary ammonium compound efflux SMR transporter [Rhodobacteraceae bacterium]|jgi:quaternary ammonium compound-resistance protein SugE|nr:QacE family quaternary ammonium compound efflux SMR transporter [Paracoccaceae bacterium]